MAVKNIIQALLITLLCSNLASSVHGQSRYPGLDLIADDQDKIEIPFRYIANFILIDVKLHGGLPMVFIFDTGAEHTILLEKQIADLLGLKYDKAVRLRGSDVSQDVVAHISRKITFGIKNVPNVKRDIVVLNENFMNLEEMLGTSIDGIIGGSFFKNLIVEIDHKKNKLILWHPDRFNKKLKGYSKSPIEIINSKPYLICKTTKTNNEEVELKLLIDSGAALTYLINTNGKKVMTAPENAVPGNLGKGIGGFINGYKGKMKSLTVGEYKFENILTHFQEIDESIDPETYNNREGLIGNILLERFNIVIDYTTGFIYLKPIRNLKEEFRYNLSGMELLSFGPELNNYIVFEVVPGSPAEEADIKVGDIISRVGYFPADRYTLFGLELKLSKNPGKTIKLQILREDSIIKKEVVLRRVLILYLNLSSLRFTTNIKCNSSLSRHCTLRLYSYILKYTSNVIRLSPKCF